MDESIMTDPIGMGKVVETAVYKHIAAFYYQFATSVGYFRGGKKNKEIDIVVDYPNIKNILIEVKYRECAPIPYDDPLLNYTRKCPRPSLLRKRPTISVLTIQHVAKNYYESLRLRSCICWAMLRSMVIEKWNDGKSSGGCCVHEWHSPISANKNLKRTLGIACCLS